METFRCFDVGSKFVRRILKVKFREVEGRQEDIYVSPAFLATVQFRFQLIYPPQPSSLQNTELSVGWEETAGII